MHWEEGDGDTYSWWVWPNGERDYPTPPKRYFITVDGKVCSDWIAAWDEEGMKSIGNLFETEERAIQALNKLKELAKKGKI